MKEGIRADRRERYRMLKDGRVSFTLAVVAVFCTPVDADAQTVSPIRFYLQDGDVVQMRHSPPPADWFMPNAVGIFWNSLPSGFGPDTLYDEVSTIGNYASIYLLREIVPPTAPLDLTLTLKHPDVAIEAYLNGTQVLTRTASDLPAPDERGFRAYDLSAALPVLLPGETNLFALHVDGAYAIPVLHGTPADPVEGGIVATPGATRIPEDGTVRTVQVLQPPGSTSKFIYVSRDDGSALNPFEEVSVEAVEGSLIQPGKNYFIVHFPDSGVATVAIRAIEDAVSEPNEGYTFYSTTGREDIQFVVPLNGTTVTRTAEDGEGSLAQAMRNAQALPGLDTVKFSEAEGVPFAQGPVVLDVTRWSSNGLWGDLYFFPGELVIEGPPPPGRVTLHSEGTHIIDWCPFAEGLTLRRLVFTGASSAVDLKRYMGTLLVEDCEFIDNDVGLNAYTSEHPALVRNCLFLGCAYTAIQSRDLHPQIENCTFVGTPGSDLFGAVEGISHCTIVTAGAQIHTLAAASNCLFVVDADTGLDTGRMDDLGGNLFTVLPEGTGFDLHPTSIAGSPEAPLDPELGPLASNGGFARTMALSATSPAIDLGAPPGPDAPPYDQRGAGFRRVVGLAPDADAFERQLAVEDLLVGAVTDAPWDPGSGLYLQLVAIQNRGPWTLSGFRLELTGLPPEVRLYNGTGEAFVDVAGPLAPGESRLVVLQYAADSPWLLVNPTLLVTLASDAADLPAPPPVPLAVVEARVVPGEPLTLELGTQPAHRYRVEVTQEGQTWVTAGPDILAVSSRTQWREPDPIRPAARWCRVVRLP